ncbi:MAG: hypothetical protein EBR05_08640, partial [Marivivens sp.]|nr:hypothetical protein [Marivivens sp.]
EVNEDGFVPAVFFRLVRGHMCHRILLLIKRLDARSRTEKRKIGFNSAWNSSTKIVEQDERIQM